MSALPVYIIWGTDPDEANDKLRPLASELLKAEADSAVLTGLMGAVATHLGRLEEGGRLSVLISRGRAPDGDDPEPPGTHASFIIDNPHGDKHVWEFVVEKRMAQSEVVGG